MNQPKNNRILSVLTQKEYELFSDRLEPVQFSLNEILLEANQNIESLYFPTKGVVSLISTMQDGSTTEIGIIGKEGMVGIHQFLGNGVSNNTTMVQINGEAMRINAKVLRTEFDRGQLLQKLLLNYSLQLFNQVSQCSSCNNHHTVQQRMARWLLMLDDRNNNNTLMMTHKLLSRMLGVRRAGVSEIAAKFQRQKIIENPRGKITILERKALEAIACECYQFVKI